MILRHFSCFRTNRGIDFWIVRFPDCACEVALPETGFLGVSPIPCWISNVARWFRLDSHLKKCVFSFSDPLGSGGRDPTFCLEAILTSQPFRERPSTNSNLCTPEHRTEKTYLGRKVSLWMSPRIAFYDYLALRGPEQSPLRREVFHLDQIGWTQIISAVAHASMRIPPDRFRCVP